MKTALIRKLAAWLSLCCCPLPIFAQPAPDATAMEAALRLRGDAAKAVKDKTDTADGALARLRAHASPSGLKLDRDADFAFAAIDVGQRLIADGDPESAEKFFREAEKSLDAVIKKTPDSAARDKAAFLQKRAWVRSLFLGKPKEAKADLDAAIALQPEDKHLRQRKDRLVTEHGPGLMDQPPKG